MQDSTESVEWVGRCFDARGAGVEVYKFEIVVRGTAIRGGREVVEVEGACEGGNGERGLVRAEMGGSFEALGFGPRSRLIFDVVGCVRVVSCSVVDVLPHFRVNTTTFLYFRQ